MNVTKAGRELRDLQAEATKVIEPELPAILRKVTDLAKAGDPHSAKLALLYTLGQPVAGTRICLPPLSPGATMTDQARAIVEAMARGTVTLEAGAQLMRAFDAVARVAAIDELAARIDRLEGKRADTIDAEEVRALA